MFFDRHTQPGWMAVLLQPQQIAFAHVRRGADGTKPIVAVLEHAARGHGSDADALGRLRRSMGLQGYRCTTLLAPGAYQLVQVDTPNVPAHELKSALRWAIKDSLDFPAEQAVVEVLKVPHEGAPAGRAPLAFAVAARREKVAERVQAFQRAGLRLTVIDIAEAAQRNVAALFEQPGRGLAMLALQEHGGLLTFTRDGELYAARHIDVDAETLADDSDAERRSAAFERIGLEVQRSLDNFDRQFSQVALQRVLVASTAGTAALVSFLSQNLYLPVEAADLTTVLDTAGHPALRDLGEQARWVQPIGIALRGDPGLRP